MRFPKSYGIIDLQPLLNLDRISSLFNSVPQDPFVEDGFRFKSIGRGIIDGDRLTPTPHGPLYQADEINPVHGGLRRRYEEIQCELLQELEIVIKAFSLFANIPAESEILYQAQRIVANSGADGATGYCVVEDWHRDGIDVLGILVTQRLNITGGISLLSKDGNLIEEATIVTPGSMLLVNDAEWLHNATPIKAIDKSNTGCRDIVILTSPSCRPPS